MLEARYLSDDALRGERGPRLLRYLLEHGADEFTIVVMALQDTQAPFADAFEDELAPFERPMAPRRVVSGIRPVRLWAFDERSLARLVGFVDESLFHWPAGPDGWLEDLTIYRAGELVLGLVSHEREGVLRLTAAEHREVLALGIPSAPAAVSIAY